MNHELVRVQGPGVENPWFKPLLPPFDKCFYTPRGHGGVWDMALSSVACVRLRPETIKNSPDTFVIIRLFLDVTVTLDVALWEKLMRPGLIPEPTLHQLYNQHTVPEEGWGGGWRGEERLRTLGRNRKNGQRERAACSTPVKPVTAVGVSLHCTTINWATFDCLWRGERVAPSGGIKNCSQGPLT